MVHSCWSPRALREFGLLWISRCFIHTCYVGALLRVSVENKNPCLLSSGWDGQKTISYDFKGLLKCWAGNNRRNEGGAERPSRPATRKLTRTGQRWEELREECPRERTCKGWKRLVFSSIWKENASKLEHGEQEKLNFMCLFWGRYIGTKLDVNFRSTGVPRGRCGRSSICFRLRS